MRVFAISDWHLSINNPKPMDIFGGAWQNYVEKITDNLNKVLENDDILLIAGDTSWAMSLENAKPDLEFISRFKGHKVLIKGNHDYWWDSISKLRAILPEKMYAIQNDAIKINSFVICGSRGWMPPANENDAENQKIYLRELIRMELSLKAAEKLLEENGKLIVLTHYPPFTTTLENPFTNLISGYSPFAVVYGHIHSKSYNKNPKTVINGIPYYLTSCDILKNVPLQLIP